MFAMFRFILLAVFIYVIFRVVQVALRFLSSGARKSNAPREDRAPIETKGQLKFKDIHDADFEDLPPASQDSGKKKDGNGETPNG